MSSYERIAELPLEIESFGLEGRELQFTEEFTRATTLIQLRGPGGETGVGEDVVYDEIDHVNLQADGRKTIDLAGSYTLDSFSKHLEETELFPAPPVRGEVSRALPALGIRVGGARPGAHAGRPLAGRRAGARAAPGELRGLDAAGQLAALGRAGEAGPRAAPARALPRHEAEARPDQPVDARAGGRARGHRRRRLARPEGPVQGHAGGRGDRPRALPDGDRVIPARLARGPGRDRRDAPDPRRGERTGSHGTRRSTRWRTCSTGPGGRAW